MPTPPISETARRTVWPAVPEISTTTSLPGLPAPALRPGRLDAAHRVGHQWRAADGRHRQHRRRRQARAERGHAAAGVALGEHLAVAT
jgi:hypothetical protein